MRRRRQAAAAADSVPGSPVDLLATGRPARRGQLLSRAARLQASRGGAVKAEQRTRTPAPHAPVAATHLIGEAIVAGASGAARAAHCCCIAADSGKNVIKPSVVYSKLSVMPTRPGTPRYTAGRALGLVGSLRRPAGVQAPP